MDPGLFLEDRCHFLVLVGFVFHGAETFQKKDQGGKWGQREEETKKEFQVGIISQKEKVAKKKEKQPEKKPAEVPSIEEVDISSIDNSKLLAILKQEKQQMKRNLRYPTFKAIPIEPEEAQKEERKEEATGISGTETSEKNFAKKPARKKKVAPKAKRTKKPASKKPTVKKIKPKVNPGEKTTKRKIVTKKK